VLTLLALGSWSMAARGPGTTSVSEVSEGGGDPADDPLRSFSIAASGDILLHEPVYARAAANSNGSGYDFEPMFDRVSPLIEDADLAVCHMETPVSSDNSDVSSFPIFNAPRQIARDLVDAGFDLCSTASNHSYDKGVAGVLTTIEVLERSGLRTEGTAANRREARTPELLDVNGVRLGHLSYTYGLNGFVLPKGQDYLVNVIDVRRILKEAARAKKLGAEFVVVSLHWGQEFQTEPNAQQLSVARKVLRSPDVDLILGHHTHVPQAIKKIRGEFVIFGMGNFISNQRPGATPTCCLPQTQDGLLVRVDVRETESGWKSGVTYWPTWVRPESYEILPVATTLGDPGFADIETSLRDSWDRTTATVASMGARKAGVRPGEIP
jgi:poly-gamma-glutamate synthesis protein (capsule biosynthesis protein)